MRNKIFEILQKHYGKLGANVTASGEVAEMVIKFCNWIGGNCGRYENIEDEGQWYYIESPMTQIDFNTFDELFTYWFENIKNKEE